MYRLGLDIGIASIGWAVLATNTEAEPFRIIDLGVRAFDKAENEKTGESLAKSRREARGARRRNRRHVHRNDRIRGRIVSYGILTKKELEMLYSRKEPWIDIYMIRYEALERALTNEELARLLIHLGQRRGFKSNRKNQSTTDKETGKILTAVSTNKVLMEEKGYRTIGEMFYKDEKFAEHKRNKSEDYSNTVARAQIVEEIKTIFEAQRSHGNLLACVELEEEYLSIFESQRSFEEGPACGPYSGNQIEKMIGRCTFEPDEPRVVKAAYSFERWNLLQNINRMVLLDSNGVRRKLKEDERQKLIILAHKTEHLTYEKIRQTLNLSNEIFFVGLIYNTGETNTEEMLEKAEKKAKFTYLKQYHTLRKTLNRIDKKLIAECSVELMDSIGDCLTKYKTDTKIMERLDQLSFPILTPEVKAAILTMPSCKQVGNLSLKAIKKMLPFLEEGMLYSEAAEAAGYDFRGHFNSEKTILLPPLSKDNHEITNPVVKRAVFQTIQLVNAIIKKYGSPMAINIELAREMSKNFKERRKIIDEQTINLEKNDKAKENLKENYNLSNPTYQDVLKMKLWQEQDGICLYSGKTMAVERLFEVGYVEIDHIIPYSISMDDGYMNKVLVMTNENQKKRNRLPLEYLQGEKRDEFIVRVKRHIKNMRKRENLLTEGLDDKSKQEFKERNLSDTKFISRFMYNYLKDNLIFDTVYTGKKRVWAVNGAVTAYMRKRWGLNKVREDGDKHHAMDAVIIGCMTDGIVQEVTDYFKGHENYHAQPEGHKRKKDQLPLPWETFRTEIIIRLSENPREQLECQQLINYEAVELEQIQPIFVSRYRKKKKTGPAHKATIRGVKYENGQQYSISKRPLSKLVYENGEIKNYYHPEDDRLLYEALVARLEAHGGKAEKAFKEPFYKPTPKGGKAPLVKSVKIIEKITDSILLNGATGIAGNGKMVRTDVFKVEGEGYYLVPIYVPDLLKETLPESAAIASKPQEQWKTMKNEDFIFSLYPNDVVHITFKKARKAKVVQKESTLAPTREYLDFWGYYQNMCISTAALTLINHDNTYFLSGVGVKRLPMIEKYSVDILGKIQKVGKSVRG